MANNYEINYEDEKFLQVEADKEQALTDIEETYGGMISESDKYYQDQINASKEWADKQTQLQQENTDFAIEKIEQQKEQAQKDYTREQSGAYVDWQKQSNQYGANAEQMAMQGMSGTGYSESSQVSMYNQYQNRVSTAREVFNKAVLNYDNSIKEAVLQNSSALAEISYQALQQQLELSLQGFQYKNALITEQLNMKQQADDRYYNRYQDVLEQMNQENAMAEQIRQYNENMVLQQQQLQEEIRQYNQTYALQEKQFQEEINQFKQTYELQTKEYEEGIRQFNEEIARLKKKDAEENALEIKKLEQQKKALEEQKRQADQDYKLKEQQLAEQKRQADMDRELKLKQLDEEKRQFDTSLNYQKQKDGKSSSGGSGDNGGVVINKNVDVDKKQDAPVVKKEGTGPLKGTSVPQSNTFGNNASTQKKSDYYFNNGYQPRYVNNTKLTESGIKTDVLGKNSGIPSGQNIWKAGNKYYAWSGSTKSYVDVTSEVTFSNGYQPKYVKGQKLQSIGTIASTMGKYGSIPATQNVWKAGNSYYVWSGNSKSYINVTKQYTDAQMKRMGSRYEY